MCGMHAPASFVLEVLTPAVGLAGLLASDITCLSSSSANELHVRAGCAASLTRATCRSWDCSLCS